MPTCHNCERTDRFVLLADVAVGFSPGRGFDAPGLSLSLQCGYCASTDVAGDPAVVAASLLDDGVRRRDRRSRR
jgi:hypothetical protein